VQLPSEEDIVADHRLLAPTVKALLAGTIAHKLHLGEQVEQPMQFSEMYENEEVMGTFMLIFRNNDGSKGSPDDYFNTRWLETVDMIRDPVNWQAITTLAEELVARTCIESPEEIIHIVVGQEEK